MNCGFLVVAFAHSQPNQGIHHEKIRACRPSFSLVRADWFYGLCGESPPLYSLIPATGSASKTETKAYVGLNWTLGGGATPALVLGAFRAKVNSNGDTTGGNLAFHVNLAGGIKPGKLKLSYLDGKEDFQGELGIGYDFLKGAPLLGLGLNAPHLSAGVDAYAGPGFVPYATLHSQGKFHKPNQTPAQCVVDPSGIYSDPDCQVLD